MSQVDFRHGALAYRLTDAPACYVGVTLPELDAVAATRVLRGALATPIPILATQIRSAFAGIDGGRAGAPRILPATLADRIGERIKQRRMMLVAYEPVSASMLVTRVESEPPRASGNPSTVQRVRRVVFGLEDVPAAAIDEKLRADFVAFKTQMTESPALFVTIVAVIAGWAASQAAPPVGLAIDVALFGFAIYALGTEAFDWAERLGTLVGKVNAAKTDADFAECSAELARLIVQIGISVFITLLLRAAGKKIGRSGAKGEPELRTAAPRAGPKPVAPAKRQTGTTVLGHNPDYQALANKAGDRYFDIPTKEWDRITQGLSKDEIFDKFNKPFIDRTIARGDDIILSNPVSKVKPDSYFARELAYLFSKGYKPSADGLSLIKPGVP